MIKLVNVSKFYSSNNVIALGLRKVNLELHRNEFVAIVGESGSGKTTLLNVISGIDSYEDGEMYINGKETSYFSVEDMENYRKKYVAFVFQNYNLIDSYTVLQNVEAPLILMGYPKEKIRERAMEIIKRVGLTDHINHKSTRLSGGQKQRVVIARALAKDCPIIAADEPTGNLDSKSAKEVIELLHEISKEKLVIIVTHDFSQVKDYATRKIRVFDGEIVEDRKLHQTDLLDLPTIPDEDYNIRFIDNLKISLKNLISAPKKTLLMIVIFTFFSFFVALSYGAFQLASEESSYNYNVHFSNTSPNRLVVRKDDNTAFTQTDLDELEALSNVSVVLGFDYVLDMSVSLHTESTEYWASIYGGYLPLSVIDEDDLKYGRMPISKDEIVVSLNEYSIDEYEQYLDQDFSAGGYYYDYEKDFGYEYVTKSYTVVGIVDTNTISYVSEGYYSQNVFVTEDLYNDLRISLYFNYVEKMILECEYDDHNYRTSIYDIQMDDTLNDNEILLQPFIWDEDTQELVSDVSVPGSLELYDYYVDNSIDSITVTFLEESNSKDGQVFVSENVYNSIFYDDIYQVSIITGSDIGVKSLMNSIEKIDNTLLTSKYKVIYPYDSVTNDDFMALGLLMTNIGLIILVTVTLTGSTLITYVIFKAIINTKMHDYAIFRTIGANKSLIKSFIYIENLYIVLVSYIIFLIVSLSIPLESVQRTVFYAIKVYNVWNYIVFFFLLIIMSLLISRRYCNKIFENTVQTTLKSDMG
jgi:ABC-type lipoprotein export system ATPase subunit